MFDESAENLAKFVDAAYFPVNGYQQQQQQQQSSLYVDNNDNKIGKAGMPIVSDDITKIYRQVASCKLWFGAWTLNM